MDFTSNASESSHSKLLSSELLSQDPLVQLTKEVKPQLFTTNVSLRNSLEHRRLALQQDRSRDQYLIFTSVPAGQSSRLSDDQSRTSKYCRFFFNTETGLLIAKVMPGPAYECAIRSFNVLIEFELLARNVDSEVLSLGSTTVTLGNWVKEADCSWAPASPDGKPSFVVEVGLSESARHLALYAHGWLESSSSSVKVVVTISINRQSPDIVLHRWELIPRGHGYHTRSTTPEARRTAFLKLSRTDNSTSNRNWTRDPWGLDR
ncbi:hypothetical protein DTO027B5_7472 [Paecilomyces variotii]|nr:hypothetical protein DTO169C6_761 [Paecilomyces variotii]KAJ9262675.1 hypothetical protein DTO195F2_3396 [Paecilomyces variotii]KAJ9286338.1 hypothetical protein DTO021C3_6048 [Paecilomyces variotii]KAJ9306970.1 hypothetical protein DTO217A2_3560 [Paecilomyces variotii]KAJ9321161.1 hypothetical protein DTO027B3_7817 [Paecilomyces variotii]